MSPKIKERKREKVIIGSVHVVIFKKIRDKFRDKTWMWWQNASVLKECSSCWEISKI